MTDRLPADFRKRMQDMLGEEYAPFEESYESARNNGIRINRLKVTPEEFESIVPFSVDPVPWIEGGYFYDYKDRAADHPLYNAGVYYIQEPSAMTPADRFPVEPGDKVLDLCAAPGGKATALAGKLQGKGILVANEISPKRAKALLFNIEAAGIGNCIVTNDSPENLSDRLPEFFDKIMVDAPCSGEGMFRKDVKAAESWSNEKVCELAQLQKNILDCAYKMLKPGGMLMYSTCTFSPDEDEQSIAYVLKNHPDMSLCEIRGYEGFSEGVPQWADGEQELSKTIRIWPHKMPGEGHFMALMSKSGSNDYSKPCPRKNKRKGSFSAASFTKEEKKLIEDFLSLTSIKADASCLINNKGHVYLKPEDSPLMDGIKVLRLGLYLGELKKGRFEPSQALAMFLKPQEFALSYDASASEKHLKDYLSGQEIRLEEPENFSGNGWILVDYMGFSLGFGKKSGSTIKNKLLCSWRDA